MWEPAIIVALSIFLTVTFFFVVYGISYIIVIKTIDLVRKVSGRIKKNDQNLEE